MADQITNDAGAAAVSEAAAPVPDNTVGGNSPWSMDWKSLSQAAGNAIHNTVQNVAQAAIDKVNQTTAFVAPWMMEGKDLAAVTQNERPQEAPVQPQAPSPQLGFDDIFNRLVGNESGGQQYDSNGNILTSNKGAQGVTQVMPASGKDPGFGVMPLQNNSREEYMRFGKDYLGAMFKNFGGNAQMAVAAYNAGPGAVQRAVQKARSSGGNFLSYLPRETQNYVNGILNV